MFFSLLTQDVLDNLGEATVSCQAMFVRHIMFATWMTVKGGVCKKEVLTVEHLPFLTVTEEIFTEIIETANCQTKG